LFTNKLSFDFIVFMILSLDDIFQD
jgi:hypothetical protein